jgi:hypothetical protein
VHEDTQLHTSRASTSDRSRDPYAEVGRAVRHSLTRLHRPLTAEEQSETGLPERPSRMAVMVHGAVATGLLASWSKLSTTVRHPLHRIADVLGLDPFADSEGDGKPGNGNRGRQSRHAIGRALSELHARGALVVVLDTDRYGTAVALLELPPVADDWTDPTYRDAPETVSEPTTTVSESETTVSVPLTRVSTALTTNEKQDEKQSERASESADERRPDDPLARSHSHAGKQERGKTVRTSEDFGDSQNPAGKRKNREGSETARTSQDVTDSKSDSRVRTLATALPPVVASKYPGGALELARTILGHRKTEHRNTLHRLGTWLDVGAVPDLRRFLDEKTKTIPPDVRSWPGLVLSWLQDLPPSPPHEEKHYRYGLPFRDAMRDAYLAGPYGILSVGTFALAAETVLDAGHDPERDPDGFVATLAATLLPHVPVADDPTLVGHSTGDRSALAWIAGDATPVPWVRPGSARDDASPRGTAALDVVGLAGTDPRTSRSAVPHYMLPGMSGGVFFS